LWEQRSGARQPQRPVWRQRGKWRVGGPVPRNSPIRRGEGRGAEACWGWARGPGLGRPPGRLAGVLWAGGGWSSTGPGQATTGKGEGGRPWDKPRALPRPSTAKRFRPGPRGAITNEPLTLAPPRNSANSPISKGRHNSNRALGPKPHRRTSTKRERGPRNQAWPKKAACDCNRAAKHRPPTTAQNAIQQTARQNCQQAQTTLPDPTDDRSAFSVGGPACTAATVVVMPSSRPPGRNVTGKPQGRGIRNETRCPRQWPISAGGSTASRQVPGSCRSNETEGDSGRRPGTLNKNPLSVGIDPRVPAQQAGCSL